MLGAVPLPSYILFEDREYVQGYMGTIIIHAANGIVDRLWGAFH